MPLWQQILMLPSLQDLHQQTIQYKIIYLVNKILLNNKPEVCFKDYKQEVEYLLVINPHNKLSSNKLIYLEQFHLSHPNSNNKIIYLDKTIFNYLVSHSQDSNNNKHLYLASNLPIPHLNKEVYLAKHYPNSHSNFSKHNLNLNNSHYFSFKINKKDKHLYLEA